ncbi:serine protease inhibitor 42Dd-like isoform X1 [Drosophila miranda]|uniref:serine protease inhibitor 42Dd-like isoform X1 n=1 Tax=Drosophila miranda TaxID=7229 RepID=UPI00143FB2A8|nr:serine protease inhibitor 42Dd-like isoform X1 [Drosophila miranda]
MNTHHFWSDFRAFKMLLRRISILVCLMALVHADYISGKLFSLISAQNDRQNFVISPVGVRAALALLFAGAEGQTAQELQIALQLVGENKNDALEEFKDIKYTISKKGTTMRIPSKIFVDRRYPLKSEYQSLTNRFLKSPAVHKHFKHSTGAAKAISIHTESASDRKVDDIVRDSDISSSSNMALTSGFYFRGDFEKPFLRMSERQPFQVPGRVLRATMYMKYDWLRCGELPALGAVGIEIPYKEGNLSLVIIMSTRLNDYSLLQQALFKNYDLLQLTDNFTLRPVLMQMPQFSIEYETSLLGLLENGLNVPTVLHNPDFSGLSKKPDLRLAAFKHKGTIEIHGGCPEACPIAPTYVETGYEKAIPFIANQPFVFFIKDETNIFFAGKLFTPMALY